jgi:hypothetical protein
MGNALKTSQSANAGAGRTARAPTALLAAPENSLAAAPQTPAAAREPDGPRQSRELPTDPIELIAIYLLSRLAQDVVAQNVAIRSFVNMQRAAAVAEYRANSIGWKAEFAAGILGPSATHPLLGALNLTRASMAVMLGTVAVQRMMRRYISTIIEAPHLMAAPEFAFLREFAADVSDMADAADAADAAVGDAAVGDATDNCVARLAGN